MDPRVVEIFKNANEKQQRYIHARLIHETNLRTCKAMGIHRSTPEKWANLDELEEALTLLRLDNLEATRMVLENERLAAVATLHREVRKSGAVAVRAALGLLDRTGFPAQSKVDVTSGGEPIQATIYIPDNGREDRD